MTVSEDEDESLAHFLETEVLSEVSDQEEEEEEEDDKMTKDSKAKRMRVAEEDETEKDTQFDRNPEDRGASSSSSSGFVQTKSTVGSSNNSSRGNMFMRIETGIFSKIPPELFPHILKFLSSEDLIACSIVCRFLNYAASDESLWRRLYCMRWGLLPPTRKLRECPWKKLYIQRDEEDMVELVRNCSLEFKEYYLQMQAAKRSQAPLPSQVNDDGIILDTTVADQVSIFKSSRGLADKVVADHACSGETCTYYQIGDVFVCEKTGQVHVCDDNCREVVINPTNELWVCTISGLCFDRLLSPAEMEPDSEQQQGVTDESEPFMGSGRFARAYVLGYNCADEKELEDALWFC